MTISSLPAFLEGYSQEADNSLLNEPLENETSTFNKRDVISEEFRTLEEDVNAVKKLKLMVEMFRRIKRNNPIAYERMVKFFEKNKKARRLRRSFLQELRSIGKKKKMVAALENKLDSTAKCHPKSGKELIEMFVKGLSELYPDMTKMLLAELQGAIDDGNEQRKKNVPEHTTKKIASTTKSRNATSKTKEEKNANREEKKKEDKKKEEKNISGPKDQSCGGTDPAPCCITTTTTECPPCRTIAEEFLHRFPQQQDAKPHESEDDDTGDIRSRSGSAGGNAYCGKNSSRMSLKRRAGISRDSKLRTAPFKDFQVQGSISFSNPNKKPISANINGLKSINEVNKISRINRAKMSTGEWKEWFPKEEEILHTLSVSPQEVNNSPEGQPKIVSGSQHHKSGFGEDKIKGCDSYIGLLNKSLIRYSNNAATRATPESENSPLNENVEPSVNPDVRGRLKRARNKKRSMYVLYEK